MMLNLATKFRENIHLNRNELAGSFGDIGTDLPLIIGMIVVSGIDSASTFIIYGILQVFSGVFYGIPMAVQPLKAVAAIVIAQQLSGDVLYGGGFAIGIIMLLMTVSGFIKKLSKIIPKTVVRGIQFGLGITLVNIALKDYVSKGSGVGEWILVALSFLLVILLLKNRKYPAAIIIIGIGILYSFIFKGSFSEIISIQPEIHLPKVFVPSFDAILQGFLLLALPQIPLSIGNSILASEQLSKDLFPQKKITSSKIALTYSFMNIFSPFFSGIPVCHGSGGMAGHYAFGARTGGSVLIYGVFFLVVGLFFSKNFDTVVSLFPMQILGVILFFEGLTLVYLIKDLKPTMNELYLGMMVGLIAFALPYGFLVALILGTLLFHNTKRIKLFQTSNFK